MPIEQKIPSKIEENIINIIDELRSENKESVNIQKENVKESVKASEENVNIQKESISVQKESNSSLQKISDLTSKIIENNKSGDFDTSSKLIKEAAIIFKETSGAEQYLNFVESLIEESANANKKFIDDNRQNIIEGNNYNEEIANRIDKSFKLADSLRNTYLKVWNAESVGYLKDMANTVQGSISSHLSDILGPVQELIDVSKRLLLSSFKFIKSIGKDFFSLLGFGKDDDETSSEKKRNNLLTKIKDSMNSMSNSFKKMIGIEKARDKADARKIPEKKPEGIWKLLLIAGALLAGILFKYAKDLTKALSFILTPFKWFGKVLKKSLNMFKEGGVFEKFGNIFKSIFGKEGKIAKFFKSIFESFKKTKIGKVITFAFEKIGSFFKSIFKPLMNFKGGPIMKLLGKWFGKGMIIGKILLPFEMAYKAIKGIFNAEGIRDKILAGAAGILDPILKIPEMIGNGILWLSRKIFGKDFLKGVKLDFGADKIISVVNSITETLGNFIDPIFNFFTETLPNLFDGISLWFEKKVDKIKFKINPFNFGKDYEEERQGNRVDKNTGALLHNAGESQDDFEKRLKKWRKEQTPIQIDKKIINIDDMENRKVEVAKNAYNIKQQQIQDQNKKADELLKSNKEISQQNQNTIQTIMTNNIISQNKQDPKEIPAQNENAILSLVSTGALM